jgi:uncharacterized protein YceK
MRIFVVVAMLLALSGCYSSARQDAVLDTKALQWQQNQWSQNK